MEKVKNILFRLEMKGRGVVNYDSSEQKWFMNAHCGTKYSNDNLKLAKKAFTKMEEVDEEQGDDTSKKKVVDTKATLKISSNCLRNAIYGSNYPNALALYNDAIFANFVTSPEMLMRGYMVTSRMGQSDDIKQSYTKKSPLTITDALETSGAVPYLEICTKDSKKEKDSNSLFYVETVGDTVYNTVGFIDIKSMRTMSDDDLFGRVSFKSEWLEGDKPLLHKVFENHYGCVPFTEGYYTSTKGILTERFAEHGIKFNDDFILLLVKDTLKRLLNINIRRANAFAETSSLYIKLVTDGTDGGFNNEEGWIKATSDNIDTLFFTPEDFYEESCVEDVTRTRKELKAKYEAQLKEEEEENKPKKKKGAKNTKDKNNEEEA